MSCMSPGLLAQVLGVDTRLFDLMDLNEENNDQKGDQKLSRGE